LWCWCCGVCTRGQSDADFLFSHSSTRRRIHVLPQRLASYAQSNCALRRVEDSRRRTLPTTAPSSSVPHGADNLRHSAARSRAGLDSLFRSKERQHAECIPRRSACVMPSGEISNWSRRTGVDILHSPLGFNRMFPQPQGVRKLIVGPSPDIRTRHLPDRSPRTVCLPRPR
jgi:hypothetical protein